MIDGKLRIFLSRLIHMIVVLVTPHFLILFLQVGDNYIFRIVSAFGPTIQRDISNNYAMQGWVQILGP